MVKSNEIMLRGQDNCERGWLAALNQLVESEIIRKWQYQPCQEVSRVKRVQVPR